MIVKRPAGRHGIGEARRHVEALAVGTDVAHEVVVGGLHLEEQPGQPGHGLLEGAEPQLGEALQLDRLVGREVLVEEQPAEEVPLLPALGEGDVRFEALRAPLVERVGEFAEELVVADAGDVRLEDQPRGDDLLVPEARDPALVIVLRRLFLVLEVEPVELAPRPLGPDVAVRRAESGAALLEVRRRQRQVLAVGQHEVDRLPDEEPLVVAAPEGRREEPAVTVLAQARREERDEGDERHLPDPERGVGPPHVVVEIGRGLAEPDGPRRGLVLARREDPARDAVGLVPEPFHAVSAEEEVRLGGGLRLVDDAGGRPEVVLDPLAGEPVAAVEQDHAAGRDGLAGLGVDLHAVGLEAHVPLLDLDVPLGEEELLAVQILDAVRVHRDRGAGLEGEPLPLLAPDGTREEGEPRDDHEPEETRTGHGPPPRRSGSPPGAVRRATVEVTRS